MDNTVSELKVGSILDSRYEIKSLIAKGGMATVYLALDQVLNRDVALKVMFPHLLDDKKFVHRFTQEARNAAVLNNAHVVKTLDQGRSGPFMYLVMEYLDGYTLRDILYQEDHLTPRQTLEALEPILAGVAAAHRAKIIHRDLKPENVLIAEDGRIKIADFGLARMMDNKTVTGSLLGTVAYMAPELVTQGDASESSDVYSLGVMMYEMLTGTQPHVGQSPMQVAYAHVNDRIPAPSLKAHGIAPELDQLVLQCTEPNPKSRPQDAAVMLAEVQRLLRILTAEELDYDFSAHDKVTVTPKVETSQIKYRPTATLVPPTRGDETELIPDFIKEHNKTLAQTRQQHVIQQPPLYNTAETQQYQQVPEYHYEQPIHVVEEPVVSEQLSSGQNRQYKKDLKKAHKQNLKNTQKNYRVQLRPGNAALRTTLGAGLVACAAGASGYLGWFFSEGPPTAQEIPNVVNQSLKQSKDQLQSAGFKTSVVEEFNQSVAPGTVFKTIPDSTQAATKNSLVEIHVSKGQAKTTIPDLTNLNADEARKKLADQGLTTGQILKEYSATIPSGNVTSTNPGAGSAATEGDAVALTISLGPKA